jgi:hypothetical protein
MVPSKSVKKIILPFSFQYGSWSLMVFVTMLISHSILALSFQKGETAYVAGAWEGLEGES